MRRIAHIIFNMLTGIVKKRRGRAKSLVSRIAVTQFNPAIQLNSTIPFNLLIQLITSTRVSAAFLRRVAVHGTSAARWPCGLRIELNRHIELNRRTELNNNE